MVERVETAIVGGGQAGLAMSWALSQQGREHVVLERAERLGERWRSDRWESFTLVTPNWTLRLPGFSYGGDDPDGFLPRDEIVQYVDAYAASFASPVRFGVEVTAVEADPAGSGFVVRCGGDLLRAANVVVATGLFQAPKLPACAAETPAGVMQLHSGAYRRPEALPPGAVLVVGSAQSGCQIADELHRAGRTVYLCCGRAGPVPRRYRGRDGIWWLERIGFFDVTYEAAPPPKSRYAGNPQMTGAHGGRTINLHDFCRDGIRLLGRPRGFDGDRLLLAPDLPESLAAADRFAAQVTGAIDGYIARAGLEAPSDESGPPPTDGYAIEAPSELNLASAGVTSIVWATGYRFDFSTVRFPVFDADGFPVQTRGVTTRPGLFFLGLHWLHTRKSGLFLGVGDDAVFLAERIAERAAS